MNQLIYPSVPFVRTHMTTANIMFLTILALLPSVGYGMYLYGLHAALLLAISVVTAVAGEALMSLILRRGLTILDYSAIVTGLIGGMLLPASAPYYYAVIVALIAVISKAACGGIGRNLLNPAGLGTIVLLLVFRSTMTDYSGGEYGAAGALTLLASGEEMTLGNMLLGHTAGPIGTGSAVTILVGAIGLLLIGVTDIYIPLAYIASFSLVWMIIGGYGLSPYQIGIQLAGGSLLFTACFMAQDNTTSPMSRQGKVIYGVLLGVITGILRRIGILESASLIALLLSNLTVRWLDTRTFPAVFGVDATVRRVRRDRRRRQDRQGSEQAAAASAAGYQDFEENVVPQGAMDGSETAGTIDADSLASFHNRRAVTYNTAAMDTNAVRRELRRQEQGMRQSMPIFGETSARTQAPAQGQPSTLSQRQSARNVQERTTPQRQQAMPSAAPYGSTGSASQYNMPVYPNGQPMYDTVGNALPLLGPDGAPVLDAYGNMIWGQPMQQPVMPAYTAPQGRRPTMPIYGQNMPADAVDDDEPVSRDTDFIEVARILEAARARERENAGGKSQSAGYQDPASGFSSAAVRQAATRLEHRPARKRTDSNQDEE